LLVRIKRLSAAAAYSRRSRFAGGPALILMSSHTD
jgi:hypothetical protein